MARAFWESDPQPAAGCQGDRAVLPGSLCRPRTQPQLPPPKQQRAWHRCGPRPGLALPLTISESKLWHQLYGPERGSCSPPLLASFPLTSDGGVRVFPPGCQPLHHPVPRVPFL